MTAITTTTIYQQSWQSLRDIVHQNVTDPLTGTTSSGRKWIYALEPDFKSADFKGYPIIVVEAPDMDDSSYNLNREFRNNILKFKITLYMKYDGYIGPAGSNPIVQIQKMSDELVNGIRTSTSITTFQNAGMHHPKIQSSPINDEDIHMQRVITRAFLIEFEVPLNM